MVMTAEPVTISAIAPTRADIVHLISQAGAPLVFEQCDFNGADLSRLDLQDAQFRNCSFRDTCLFAASLARTQCQRCRAGQADFASADLVDAHFDSCDLNNTIWRRARMASATFNGCKLTGAHFEEVGQLGLVLRNSLMVGAYCCRMSFHKARLVGIDFQDADLSGCDFREAVFEDCSIRHAHLTDTRFEGADLRGADIAGVKLSNARLFKGATISHRQAAELMLELGLLVG